MVQTATERRSDALRKAIREANTHAGQALPNGAIILKQVCIKEHDDRHEYIVLAVNPGFQPFITWLRITGISQKATGGWGTIDYCVSGSYHRDLEDALESYMERVGSHG